MQKPILDWLFGPCAPASWRSMDEAPQGKPVMIRVGARMFAATKGGQYWFIGGRILKREPDGWVPMPPLHEEDLESA